MKNYSKLIAWFEKTWMVPTEILKTKRKNLVLFSPDNVWCIQGRTALGDRIVNQFIYEEREIAKAPKLDYKPKAGEVCSAKYGAEELLLLTQLIKLDCEEAVVISLCKDEPIQFKTDNFYVTLAPRVPNE